MEGLVGSDRGLHPHYTPMFVLPATVSLNSIIPGCGGGTFGPKFQLSKEVQHLFQTYEKYGLASRVLPCWEQQPAVPPRTVWRKMPSKHELVLTQRSADNEGNLHGESSNPLPWATVCNSLAMFLCHLFLPTLHSGRTRRQKKQLLQNLDVRYEFLQPRHHSV